jgi:hypothetical protein
MEPTRTTPGDMGTIEWAEESNLLIEEKKEDKIVNIGRIK